MNNRKKDIEPIPEEFVSYEEAAEFWDTHDTTDYPEAFQTVNIQTDIRKIRYEVEIEDDIIKIIGSLVFPVVLQTGYRHKEGRCGCAFSASARTFGWETSNGKAP